MGRGRAPARNNRQELAKKRKRQFYKNAKLIQRYRSVREKEGRVESGDDAGRGGHRAGQSSGPAQPRDFYEMTFGQGGGEQGYRFDGRDGMGASAWDDGDGADSNGGSRDTGADTNASSRNSGRKGEGFRPLGRKANRQRIERPNPYKKQLSQQKAEKRRALQKAAETARKKEQLARSLKQRKKQAKKMGRRSRRGQPVMENHIDQILAKLKRPRP
eukprot:g1749.t1